MYQPIEVRPHLLDTSGVQKIYRFDNGYGASVVRFRGSYGGEDGLWEMGVIEFTGPNPDDFYLTYFTALTHDVLGYLNDADVEERLTAIAALPVTTVDAINKEKRERDEQLNTIMQSFKDVMETL